MGSEPYWVRAVYLADQVDPLHCRLLKLHNRLVHGHCQPKFCLTESLEVALLLEPLRNTTPQKS